MRLFTHSGTTRVESEPSPSRLCMSITFYAREGHDTKLTTVLSSQPASNDLVFEWNPTLREAMH